MTTYVVHRNAIRPYTTRDDSEIRELIHPGRSRARNQSLAEATVLPGAATRLHRHRVSEEIYYITGGHGRMTLGEEVFPVERGDSVLIPPGTPHRIENTGDIKLVFLCACAPAYTHEDTELL